MYAKLLMLSNFCGRIGPQFSYGLPIYEYITLSTYSRGAGVSLWLWILKVKGPARNHHNLIPEMKSTSPQLFLYTYVKIPNFSGTEKVKFGSSTKN